MTLTITKLTPTIGAEVSGVDLNADLSQGALDAIYQALMDNLVIFFRDQEITPAAHLAFARSFGEPEPPHPVYPHVEGYENIVLLANDVNTPPDTDGWHTDVSFRQDPAFASILVARKVPETGGDTMWMSQIAAYEALPDGMKADLDGLTATHDMGDFRNNFAGQGAEAVLSAYQRFGNAIHDVVKVHPVTGQKFLYVNEGFTQQINGLTARQSKRLLAYLLDHINRPEYQVRFKWRKNSIAMWDNRATQHYAVADYMPHYRCMNRITVTEDRRIAQRAQTAAE